MSTSTVINSKMMTRVAVAVLVILVVAPAILAVTYEVGDSSGWTAGVDYTTWLAGKTFRVGDTLEFTYGGSHSLSIVDKDGYDNCDSTGATQTFTDGDTKIDLTTPGTLYFLCPVFGHCLGGMKLAVPVLAVASSPPPSQTPSPPSQTPSPPPKTPSPPPKTPSPPSKTPSPRSPPSPPKSASPPGDNTLTPLASPPENDTPDFDPEFKLTPQPQPPSPPSNAAIKGYVSYGIMGGMMVLMCMV